MRVTYIYRITNLLEENSFYIGLTNNPAKRWQAHKICARNINWNYKSIYLYNAMNKYGVDNFSFEIIEVCESLEQANEREIFYISELEKLGIKKYNITPGGGGFAGRIKSEEERNATSAKLKGENCPAAKLTQEQVDAIRVLANTTDMTKTAIAKLFPIVTRESVNRLILGRSWAIDGRCSQYIHNKLSQEELTKRNYEIAVLYKTGKYFLDEIAECFSTKEHSLGERQVGTIIRQSHIPQEELNVIDKSLKEKLSLKLGGENASKGKLTWDIVNEIRRLKKEDPKLYTNRYLADYVTKNYIKVTHSAIKDIVLYKTWCDEEHKKSDYVKKIVKVFTDEMFQTALKMHFEGKSNKEIQKVIDIDQSAIGKRIRKYKEENNVQD